jgi:hypothetical protein
MPQQTFASRFVPNWSTEDDTFKQQVRQYIQGHIQQGFAQRQAQLSGRGEQGAVAGDLGKALGATGTMSDGALAAAKSAVTASGPKGLAMVAPLLDGWDKANLGLNLASQGAQGLSDVQNGTPWDDSLMSATGRLGADALGGVEGGMLGGIGGPVGAGIGGFAGVAGTEASCASDAAGRTLRQAYDQLKNDWSF